MRRAPLCSLALAALATRKGKTAGAKQWHRCARPYSHAPTCRRGSSELGRRAHRAGAAAKAEATGGTMHTPVLPRPHLSMGDVQAQGGVCRTEQKAPAVHARTPTPPPFGGGRPSYKATCTAGRAEARRSDGGDATGVMDRGGSCRIKTWSSHCRWPNTLRVTLLRVTCREALSIKNSGERVIEQVTCNIEQSCKKKGAIS